MVKKLRYYARFIVVTLLLNKMDFVEELAEVEVYNTFKIIIKRSHIQTCFVNTKHL